MTDLIVVAVLAVICGAARWAQVRARADRERKWLATFLDRPGGPPSHDPFGRVFARLKTRRVWATADVADLGAGRLSEWPDRAAVALVEPTRLKAGWDHDYLLRLICKRRCNRPVSRPCRSRPRLGPTPLTGTAAS